MFIEHSKLTDGDVRFLVSYDKADTHVFTVRAKLGDWTQGMFSLTQKEAENLVEQLNFAIQDFLISQAESSSGENARDIVEEMRVRQEQEV